MTPEYIAKYRVERLLGSGSFASVWLAYDPDLDSLCAVKVLADNWSQDERARRWFLEEARVMFGIDHPCILRVFTFGTLDDGRPYFVTEYADRGNLAERIRQRRQRGEGFSVPEALAISLSIAEGLQAAHRRGVAHRDLKPRNILLKSARLLTTRSGSTAPPASADEEIKLADFGRARQLAQATNSLAGAGSPLYMAPEQLRATGNDLPDPRSDIYAAAAILYEMLAGRVPFPYDSVTEVVTAHLTEQPADLRMLRPDVPVGVAALVHAGLEKDPNKRIGSIDRWVDGLRWLIQQRGGAGRFRFGAASDPPVPAGGSPLDAAGGISDATTAPTGVLPSSWHRRRTVARRPDSPFLAPAHAPRGRGRVFRPDLPDLPGQVPRPGVVLYFGALATALVLFGLIGLIILSLRPQDEPAATIEPTPEATAVVERPAQQGGSEPSPTPEPTEPPAVANSVTPTPTATPTPEPTPSPTPVDPETLRLISASLAELPGSGSSLVILPTGADIDDAADRQLPAASLIKLWIAATAYEEASTGGLDLAGEYVVQAADQMPGTGILGRDENLGRTVSYEELIEIMLLYSDNTAANILITSVGGLDRINRYAADHGYTSTLMQRRLGELDPQRENYTSARDCGLFFRNLLDGAVVDEASSAAIRGALEQRRINEPERVNFFGRSLPNGVGYAHISGLLPAARHEAGYYYTESGEPVIVVILLATLPDENAGENAIAGVVGDIYAQVN
jgi:eukaryotic-like serine/threonine-protein kinase